MRCRSIGVRLGGAWLLTGAALAAQLSVIERESLATGGGQAGNGSYQSRISADGRVLAFVSQADDLVPGDTNGWSDIFVRDRVTGVTERVSVSSEGAQADQGSWNVAISGDGRFVAFDSDATNLVPGDTNGFADIFVRDRLLGTTERVSVSRDGVQAELPCVLPDISDDGRRVAFQSYASQLVAGTNAFVSDVFVKERSSGLVLHASRSTAGEPGKYNSTGASLSADGRYVVFESWSGNLVHADSNGTLDVFLHDTATRVTTRVSVSSFGQQGNGPSISARISDDGRVVVFSSWSSTLVPSDVNGETDIYARDLDTGLTTLVSVAPGGALGDNHSAHAAVSGDGRWVVFHSDASNLVPGDLNVAQDVFLADRVTGRLTRLSVNDHGREGELLSLLPDISAAGDVVVFDSYAGNLVSGDTNRSFDVFSRTLSQP